MVVVVNQYVSVQDRAVVGFPRRPFKLTHGLRGHPLFELGRLEELVSSLPAESIEYNAGDVAISQDPDTAPQTGLTPAETIRRIEDCESWMLMHDVESDPEYAQLLDAVLDEVAELTEPIEPGMHERRAFIIVSSAASVTPYHFDPEQNFLLQVRGSKQVHVFDPFDDRLVSETDRERVFAGKGKPNLDLDDALSDSGEEFRLDAGEGLCIPFQAPHWVRVGNGVSISFSMTWQTHRTEHFFDIHRVNMALRRAGLTPVPPGRSPWRDAVKQTGVDVVRGVARGTKRLARRLR